MKVAVYSARAYEKEALQNANAQEHDLLFIDQKLHASTLHLATGCQVVSVFVNDDVSAEILHGLSDLGVRFVALRCAGYNNVDVAALRALKMSAARVAAYSPHAVAEHAVALMLALNRKLIVANERVHRFNFTLDGLVGFDMHHKTVGIFGTGTIGAVAVQILHGFGCKVVACDKIENQELISRFGLRYVSFDQLCAESDIVSLHLPLLPDTKYLVNKSSIAKMKKGVMLINTSRGALIDTRAAIEALRSGHIGALGIDVYEAEQALFFDDHSAAQGGDPVLAELMTFSNVLLTGHQAFLTKEALQNIAVATLRNINCFASGEANSNAL